MALAENSKSILSSVKESLCDRMTDMVKSVSGEARAIINFEHPDPQISIVQGLIYLYGIDGVTKSYTKAFEKPDAVVEGGQLPEGTILIGQAMAIVGAMYGAGLGTRVDSRRAMRLFEQAGKIIPKDEFKTEIIIDEEVVFSV